MNAIIKKLLGIKSAPTAVAIASEIARTTAELKSVHEQMIAALDGLAVMTDEQHEAAETSHAALKRKQARLHARLDELQKAHNEALAAEETARQEAAAEAFRQRVDAARNAVEVEGAELLAQYDSLASKIGDILSRIDAINFEVVAVNQALRMNPVAETVPHTDAVHRKQPDHVTEAVIETKMCWVTVDPATGEETARPADKDERGNFIPPFTLYNTDTGVVESPPGGLGQREVVTTPERRRTGATLPSLASIVLHAGFSTGSAHYPRA